MQAMVGVRRAVLLGMRLLLPFVAIVTTVWAAPTVSNANASRIAITVTRRGFAPEDIKVPSNTPVTLVFTRTTDDTCAKTVVIELGDSKSIERELPLDQPVAVGVTFAKPGTLGYACNMGMAKGTIVVQ